MLAARHIAHEAPPTVETLAVTVRECRRAGLSAARPFQDLRLRLKPTISGSLRDFRRRGTLESADLRSVADLALLIAIDSYDPAKGPFAPWARRHIRSRLRDVVISQSQDVHKSHGAFRAKVVLIDAARRPVMVSLEELARSAVTPDPFDAVLLEQCLTHLTDLEREVIHGLFGREQSLRQLAGELGMSRQQVAKVRDRALARLRALMAGHEPETVPPVTSRPHQKGAGTP